MRFGSLVLFQSRGNVVINAKSNSARNETAVVMDQGAPPPPARHPNESNESGGSAAAAVLVSWRPPPLQEGFEGVATQQLEISTNG